MFVKQCRNVSDPIYDMMFLSRWNSHRTLWSRLLRNILDNGDGLGDSLETGDISIGVHKADLQPDEMMTPKNNFIVPKVQVSYLCRSQLK